MTVPGHRGVVASPALAMVLQRVRPASVAEQVVVIWEGAAGRAVPAVEAVVLVAVVAEAAGAAVAVVNPPLPCTAYLYLRRIR